MYIIAIGGSFQEYYLPEDDAVDVIVTEAIDSSTGEGDAVSVELSYNDDDDDTTTTSK